MLKIFNNIKTFIQTKAKMKVRRNSATLSNSNHVNKKKLKHIFLISQDYHNKANKIKNHKFITVIQLPRPTLRPSNVRAESCVLFKFSLRKFFIAVQTHTIF